MLSQLGKICRRHQSNAIWLKVTGQDPKRGTPECIKEIFTHDYFKDLKLNQDTKILNKEDSPIINIVKHTNLGPTKNKKWTGISKIYFANDEMANYAKNKRFETKWKGHKCFIDLVTDQKSLLLESFLEKKTHFTKDDKRNNEYKVNSPNTNLNVNVTTDDISNNSHLFPGLISIEVLKDELTVDESEKINRYRLEFEDYIAADAVFESKVSGKLNQINGKKFGLFQEGARMHYRKHGNRRKYNHWNK